MSLFSSNLTSDEQPVPAVQLHSLPAVAAAWAAAIGGADRFHPVVTLAACTAHSSCWALLGAGCRTKAPPQRSTPPTVSVYCKHATAEVTGEGFLQGHGRFCDVGSGVAGFQQVMEREKLWGVLFEVIIHCTALAHQTAATDGYIWFLFALAFFCVVASNPSRSSFGRVEDSPKLRNFIKACLGFNQRHPWKCGDALTWQSSSAFTSANLRIHLAELPRKPFPGDFSVKQDWKKSPGKIKLHQKRPGSSSSQLIGAGLLMKCVYI